MALKNGELAIIINSIGLVLTICIDEFPSSEAFDVINSSLTSSDAERKEAIKQGNAVFAFTLKNKAGKTESWHIDLKEKGEVGTGLGEKPTGKNPLESNYDSETKTIKLSRSRSCLSGCLSGRNRIG